MAFEQYIKTNKEQFLAKARLISDKLGIDVNWLLAVMYKESGLNEKAVNKNGGATGLIQFMPSTARGLGTTTANLLQMSNVEQLDYVYLYFKPMTGKIHSYGDLYMYTFFPAAVGKSDDTVIKAKNLPADTIAKANPVADLNKDSVITVGEFKKYALKGFSVEQIAELLKKK